MMKEFDFNDIGKREPYAVSEGELARVRQCALRLWMERACRERRGRTSGVLRWTFALGAVAALVAVSMAGIRASRHKLLMYRYEHLVANATAPQLEDVASAYAEDFQEQVTDIAPEDNLQNTVISIY